MYMGGENMIRRADKPGGTAVVDLGQLDLSHQITPDGQPVVTVTGEIDIATADEARSYLCGVIDTEPLSAIVDVTGVTFCDAAGLGMFAKVAQHARDAGRPIRLTGVRPSLVKIMRITGLDAAYPELRTLLVL
jgi:anti-sigma B factor antagonist